MNNLRRLSKGEMLTVEVTCPSVEQLINAAVNTGISLNKIMPLNCICWRCCTNAYGMEALERLALRYGGSVCVISSNSFLQNMVRLYRRSVLTATIILILLLTCWLPTRVLFINISGNNQIADSLILEKAALCGIEFGATRSLVRSEAVKNRLLLEIPELQWVGVNTQGCVATILVEEREQTEAKSAKRTVSNIIAAWDGVIRDITVYRGNPICKPRQVVEKGQVLVSGYTDCGFCIKAESAEAEITALTKRTIHAVSPQNSTVRPMFSAANSRYILKVGKKLIKLYKDSGISSRTCVRIYKEFSLILPGDYVLPVCLGVEELLYYDSAQSINDLDCQQDWMEAVSDTYLKSQMLSGQILRSRYTRTLNDGVWYQCAEYDCIENIGQVHEEERLLTNGKTD